MSVEVVVADITTLQVDAIVNAANSSLMGGGGVDGAIHRAGGPAILDECRQIVARSGRLPAGQAVATTAGRLPARHVVHTVGPVYRDDPEAAPGLLASCYRRSLALAAELGARSLAFPSISTGVYGYPVVGAAGVAVPVLAEHDEGGREPRRLVMCCFSEPDRAAYQAALDARAS